MNQYHEPPGRLLEVIVGFATTLISVIFAMLFFMLVLNAGLKYVTFIGGSILAFFTYWFGLVSYSLVLNKPNEKGGLFSVGGLKFLSLFLGVACLVVAPLAIYLGHWGAFLGCAGMVVGCVKGWQLAGNRGSA